MTKTIIMEDKIFYDHLPGFVKYFADFLSVFSEILEENILEKQVSEQERNRLIFLLKMDNKALDEAMEIGIHPITGVVWSKHDEVDVQTYNILKTRNNKMINRLKKEMNPVKQEVKSS